MLSLSLYLLLTLPSRPFVNIFVWSPAVKCLILSADSLTRRVFLTVSAFKELVIVAFRQFICEHILFTLGEEFGENVILVMKYDNKEKQSHYMLNHRHAIQSYKHQTFRRQKQKPRYSGCKNPRSEIHVPQDGGPAIAPLRGQCTSNFNMEMSNYSQCF